MSEERNIIGIVKELQELEKSLPFMNFQMERDGDFLGLWKDDGSIGMIGSIPSERAREPICAILNHFPAIAQALILAVEALQVYEAEEKVKELLTPEGQAIPHNLASRTLKKIRELYPPK